MEFISNYGLFELFNKSNQGYFRLWSNQKLMKITSLKSSLQISKDFHDCVILYIYSTKCKFSKASLPYLHALARAFPQLRIVGVQVQDYLVYKWSLRMFYSPKTKLLVDGKIFQEYTDSDINLNSMVEFVWKHFRKYRNLFLLFIDNINFL